jgi:hypothetical protein
MNGNELHEYMESYRKIEDSLSSTVKISHSEVLILVVTDLISKRNANKSTGKEEIRNSFDKVLRYYISADEFERFVINGEKVL